MQNKRLLIIFLSVVVILSIPLIAMQFSNEVNWSVFDFLIAGILLFGTGLALEFVIKTVKTKNTRIILIVAVIVLLILVWLELAVGIFGTPFAGS